MNPLGEVHKELVVKRLNPKSISTPAKRLSTAKYLSLHQFLCVCFYSFVTGNPDLI